MALLNYKIFPSEIGTSEESPLLILHGLLGSMDNWRSQAKLFAKHRTVITLDLRNHGDSPHIKGMSYREMYEDVIKVVQAENIESFDLLGHSMGGKVAMQLALAHPEMVNRLIVVDIAPKPYPLWHQEMFKAVMSVPINSITKRSEVDEHLKNAIDDRAERSFMLKNIKRNTNTEEGEPRYSWKPNLKEISRGYLKIAGFTTALSQYSNKTLFIKGELSPYVQDFDHTVIQSLFPSSKIITIKESGHLPHIQQKERFFEEITQFLENKNTP